ncbi:ATP-dependent DNA helicase PIF1 [Bagarius yarrelli]|uniref:ATP-dependent DNA helicase n=1 Tax=Bagarius yarrelli TaxID=175774 RepID=A0A556V3L5_BAGYA|nr:ATP-dependent DNA helicase PIF1 [Bagarius yarrelli]
MTLEGEKRKRERVEREREQERDELITSQLQRTKAFGDRMTKPHSLTPIDGKCTVNFPQNNSQLLISNCPPDRLKTFLKTLSIKNEASRGINPVTERARMRAGVPRSFETISPVQQKDIQKANELRSKVNAPVQVKVLTERALNSTVGRQPVKRPRVDDDISPDKALHPHKKPILIMPVTQKLSKEQMAVLNAVLSGKNVFFTGSAGTGKSFLLKRIVGSLPPKSAYATASTGVAACHIGGTTLHSFAGIGSGSAPLEQCLELAQRPGVLQHWISCKHLIIDEISMVEAEFFDKLESIARHARSWRKCIHVNMELTEVRRQTDRTFISLLQAVRLGRVTEEVTARLLKSASNPIERDGIVATRLCTHKDDVELTNDNKLRQLPGPLRVFEALDSDPTLVKTIDAQSPVGQMLQLKVGAQVMLTKNLDVQRGLVNGARGVVVDFLPGNQGLPRVRFLCGAVEVMKRERWTFKAMGGLYLSRQQLPLKLAWAISIHKSQGMTLDCVEISLARVFESGQAYVALSRARSLEGLRVMDFDPRVVQANSDVLMFYKQLKRDRLLLQASTRAKVPASKLALQHFDAMYQNHFGDLWPSVRIAMLSEQKYGALINNFSSNTDMISTLQLQGCRDFIGDRKGDAHNGLDEMEQSNCSRTTSNVQCFVFPRGDVSRFKPARPDSGGLLSYYLLDAASVLPVLALDVQPGHAVLDLCAGPGGKTLAILQSGAVRFLWANDLSGSRTDRLQRMLQSYVPRELRGEDKIRVTSLDGRKWRNMEEFEFDRVCVVLVDVPCTTDRHSLIEDENNIFKRSRTKERQTLPLLQLQLLLAGLQATRPGGVLLYSTCSLSQLQNECVVQQALSLAQQEMDLTVQVQNLSSFTRRFSDTFHFAPQPALGELILPHLCANFGPIFLCKLLRVR